MAVSLLHAFRNPIIITSILVMMINDHVLKASSPSWITGKISDFTCLFFFPFLAGFLLQQVGKLSSRRSLLISFLFTALLFTSIKTVPEWNLFLVNLFSILLNQPVKITLDPTDLIALTIFVPAWILWDRIEKNAQPPEPGKWAYLILGAASLATMATSCPYPYSVDRLVVVDGKVYGSDKNFFKDRYIWSKDQGKTWNFPSSTFKYTNEILPEEIDLELKKDVKLPLISCDPLRPLVCYRIIGTDSIDETLDGGKTWKTAWQIPPGRYAYMQRTAEGLLCGWTPTQTIRDIAWVPSENGSTLIAAFGNSGVIVHSPNGPWERVFPSHMEAPFAAKSFSDAFKNTLPELILSLASGYLALLSLGIASYVFLIQKRQPNPQPGKSVLWAMQPLGLAGVWLLFLALLFLVTQLDIPFIDALTGNFIWLIFAVTSFVATPIILVIGVFVAVERAFKLTHSSKRLNSIINYLAIPCLLIVVISWIPFLLWAYNLIALYENALIIAVTIGLAILGFGILWLHWSVREAVEISEK